MQEYLWSLVKQQLRNEKVSVCYPALGKGGGTGVMTESGAVLLSLASPLRSLGGAASKPCHSFCADSLLTKQRGAGSGLSSLTGSSANHDGKPQPAPDYCKGMV